MVVVEEEHKVVERDGVEKSAPSMCQLQFYKTL